MPTACLLGYSDPGHSWHLSLDSNGEYPAADYEGQVSAGGPAGSVVIHNGGMSDPNVNRVRSPDRDWTNPARPSPAWRIS
jgi:hypothetical protein